MIHLNKERNWHSELIIPLLLTLPYGYLGLDNNIPSNNLYNISTTILSIIYGFFIIIVTQYYTNKTLNRFLKKINEFQTFKNKNKRLLKTLTISLIIIYLSSTYSKYDFIIIDHFTFKLLIDLITVFLCLHCLVLCYICINQFFNIYGSTYSNTINNFKNQ